MTSLKLHDQLWLSRAGPGGSEMLRGLDPPGARRRPLRAPDSALPRQRAGRTGLDQGPALDCSCELKGGWSPGIPQLDKSAGCSGVKFGWAMTLCVWGWLLPATCASSRQGQARSLSLLPTPSLPRAAPPLWGLSPRGFAWKQEALPCPNPGHLCHISGPRHRISGIPTPAACLGHCAPDFQADSLCLRRTAAPKSAGGSLSPR